MSGVALCAHLVTEPVEDRHAKSLIQMAEHGNMTPL